MIYFEWVEIAKTQLDSNYCQFNFFSTMKTETLYEFMVIK